MNLSWWPGLPFIKMDVAMEEEINQLRLMAHVAQSEPEAWRKMKRVIQLDQDHIGGDGVTYPFNGRNIMVTKVFLTAKWEHLAMLNYEVESSVLARFVPAGTELDSWNGKIFVSVVGFLFQQTRIFGIPVPFHRNFEEVNLRFYVRRKASDGWRRGVVFIKEIVPRLAIALAARKFYNEPYVSLPMAHQIEGATGSVKSAEFSWRFGGRQNTLKITTKGEAQPLRDGSEAEFITEHYWGYNERNDRATLEYRVEHPRWRVYESSDSRLDCDIPGLYGPQFRDSLSRNPSSAFLAEGSAVTVYQGVRLLL